MRIMIVDDQPRHEEALIDYALNAESRRSLPLLPFTRDTSRFMVLEAGEYTKRKFGEPYIGNNHIVNKPLPTRKKRTRWKMAKRSKRQNR